MRDKKKKDGIKPDKLLIAKAEALLETERKPFVREYEDFNLIHKAAWRGNNKCLLMAIEAGIDVDLKDGRGWTPLHNAVWREEPQCVKTLLDAGADINAVNINGDTPLHLAALYDQTEEALLLVKAGADINIRDNSDMTAIEIAARSNHTEWARTIADSGKLRAEDTKEAADTGYEFDI